MVGVTRSAGPVPTSRATPRRGRRVARAVGARCRAGAVLHRGECGGDVVSRPLRQPGVDAGRCEEIGVLAAEDVGHRGAGGQTRHVDAARIGAVRRDDSLRHFGEQARFAAVAMLVGRCEPVPALRVVRARRLGRVQDQETALLGDLVHARTGREIVRRLGAAVQHHDQRKRTFRRPARHEELVGALAEASAVLVRLEGARPRREAGGAGCTVAVEGSRRRASDSSERPAGHVAHEAVEDHGVPTGGAASRRRDRRRSGERTLDRRGRIEKIAAGGQQRGLADQGCEKRVHGDRRWEDESARALGHIAEGGRMRLLTSAVGFAGHEAANQACRCEAR